MYNMPLCIPQFKKEIIINTAPMYPSQQVIV